MITAGPVQKFVNAKDAVGLYVALIIMLVLNHAGGHIIAPVVAFSGVIGFVGHRIGLINWSSPLLLSFAAFFIWILLSSFWSPFEDTREFKNLYRFALGIPLYALAALWLSDLTDINKSILRGLMIFLLPLSVLIFMLDIITGFGITLSVDPEAVPSNIEANMGHGISAVLLFAVPSLIYLLQGGVIKRLVAAVLVISLITIGLTSNNTAFLVALSVSALVFAFAFVKPRLCFSVVIAIFGALIAFAPGLAYLASNVSDERIASVPMSWEWRIESWRYIYHNLQDGFLFGHGFDALRAVDATFDSRSFTDLPVIPMHAHNIGLQIWYELGLVGILLFCTALYFAARSVFRSKLDKAQIIALCGVTSVALSFSALSYSPWSDWWLGAIFWAFGMVFCIKPLSRP